MQFFFVKCIRASDEVSQDQMVKTFQKCIFNVLRRCVRMGIGENVAKSSSVILYFCQTNDSVLFSAVYMV